jgi:Domain of unknown function (DUF4351)
LKTYRDWYAIELTRQQEFQQLQQLQQDAERRAQEAERQAQEALEGLERSRQEQTIALITRQLSRRFQQELPEEMRSRLTALPFPQLEALGEMLLDFATLADLEQWLAGASES